MTKLKALEAAIFAKRCPGRIGNIQAAWGKYMNAWWRKLIFKMLGV